MKTQFVIALLCVMGALQAQNFSMFDFKPNGYPFSAGFPSTPKLSNQTNTNDTSVTATSTESGITYALSINKVKDKALAARVIPNIIKKKEAKAIKINQKKSSTLLGQPSIYIEYTNEKGVFIAMHTLSIDRYIVTMYTLNKKEFPSEAQNNAFFNTLKQ